MKKRLSAYYLILGMCCAAFIWLGFNHFGHNEAEFGVCIIKETTGIPCPSCGSTRSVLALFEGHLGKALFYNPFGLLLFIGLIILPIWVSIDLIQSKTTLLKQIHRFENRLKQKPWIFGLSLLVLANWLWNIVKGI